MPALLRPRFRARERRVTLCLSARVRHGGSWRPAHVHNASLHGMMIAASITAAPGSYLEICCGGVDLAGRIMWRTDRFIGIRAQQPVDVAALQALPGANAPAPAIGNARTARLAEEALLARKVERSRRIAGIGQFAVLGLLGLGGAATLSGMVRFALSPLDVIAAFLPG